MTGHLTPIITYLRLLPPLLSGHKDVVAFFSAISYLVISDRRLPMVAHAEFNRAEPSIPPSEHRVEPSDSEHSAE